MYLIQPDEVLENIKDQYDAPKISPPKWQTIRRLEQGLGAKFFPNQRSSPIRTTNPIPPMTNLTRIKNSLKCTMQSVIRPRQEESKINGQFDIDEDFFRKSAKLNVTLTKQDMHRISFDFSKYFREYQELEIIGEGCIGLVKGLVELKTGDKYAVKQVSTNDEEIVTNMIKEFRSLVHLQHPNIVKVHKLFIDFKDGFQDQSKIYVIMELVEGKEMFQSIQELGHYSEEITKQLFHQLLNGIHFLHNHGICHRDLKPNNLLCSEKCDQLKITDFNVSKFSENYKGFFDIEECDQIEMWTYTGTVAFSAPEIFIGYGYNEKVDLWSAGCVLFTMLCGVLPFQQDLNDLIDQICSGQFEFPPDKWLGISEEAQDLIRNLLVVDSDKRYSAAQALKHEWFKNKNKDPTESIKRIHLNRNICRLTRRHERKNKKQRSNFILFGAKHLYQKAKSSDEDQQFHPFDRKKILVARSAELLVNANNIFDFETPKSGSQTSIQLKPDFTKKYCRSRFALSHQSPQNQSSSNQSQSSRSQSNQSRSNISPSHNDSVQEPYLQCPFFQSPSFCKPKIQNSQKQYIAGNNNQEEKHQNDQLQV